jgi:hypothetical protein
MHKFEKGEREGMCSAGISLATVGIALIISIFYRKQIWGDFFEKFFFVLVLGGPLITFAGIGIFIMSFKDSNSEIPFSFKTFFYFLFIHLSFTAILIYGAFSYWHSESH